MVVESKRKVREENVEYEENKIEEGILDIYVRFCQKLKIPPIIGAIDFIFLVVLLLSTILVFSNRDLYSTIIFSVILGLFTITNLYAYKKEKESEKK